MTAANKITLVRIGLIPAFVWLAWAYGRSFAESQPEESYRFGAIAIFVLAACTDGIDGFVARQFHQQSRLGAILDPIADKVLVCGAILGLLSLGSNAPVAILPMWWRFSRCRSVRTCPACASALPPGTSDF